MQKNRRTEPSTPIPTAPPPPWQNNLEAFTERLKRYTRITFRVRNIIQRAAALYDIALTEDDNAPPENIRHDIARAAIVYTHAAVDDYLREVQRLTLTLPTRPPNALSHLRAVPLKQLAKLRGQSVDAALKTLIDSRLEHYSVGSFSQLKDVLERTGLSVAHAEAHKDPLVTLFDQRHRIVHAGDIPDGDTAQPDALSQNDIKRISISFLSIFDFIVSLHYGLLDVIERDLEADPNIDSELKSHLTPILNSLPKIEASD